MSLEANDRRLGRNLGFFSVAEQRVFSNTHFAVAGAGGDGGALAIMLARMGAGKISMADPEVFDVENLNRQAASTEKTLGRNKAASVAAYINSINPDIETKVYADGVTEDNIDEFIGDAALVIDETEYTMPHIGVMIARAARKRGRPVLAAFNVGFGAFVTSYNAEGDPTFEASMGLDPHASLEEISRSHVPVDRWLGHVPSYADLTVFQRVAGGEVSAPSVAPGVAIAAGAAAVQALCHVSPEPNRPAPIFAPRGIVFDPFDGLQIIESTPTGFAESLGVMMANNAAGKIVPVTY